MVSFSPRVSSKLPMDAEARPLPSEETTPPVTKMNFVCLPDGLAAAVIAWAPRPVRVCLTPRRMSSSTRESILVRRSDRSQCKARKLSRMAAELILIIEDDVHIGGLVAQVLQEAGYKPELVRDVGTARALAAQGLRPAAMISDLMI